MCGLSISKLYLGWICLTLWCRYLIYVDDMTCKDPGPFSVFEQRFLSGQPQLNPVLDALVGVLLRLWDLYDPLCANSITSSVFNYFTATCLEANPQKLSLVQGTERFSDFLRTHTGVSIAFAAMMFTKSTEVDITEYFQAIPDMDFWIGLTNDLLSFVSPFFLSRYPHSLTRRRCFKFAYSTRFYKEELAGETTNYIHTRAYIENKAPLEVLAEMAKEMRVSKNSIHKALSHSPKALHVWKVFEYGYV